MAEYIQRSYIRKMAMFEMAYTMETETDAAVVLRMIDDAPAADVAPVVHGRWEKHYRSGTPVAEGYVSTCCDMWNKSKRNYCPNCGAKMDGGDSDADKEVD